MGILYKYQENFFSASFHERLVVLCCLGLMYFEENEKCPKVIIPIIGTTIKSLTIKGVEKPIGIFDREDHITRFRTLGAKRYMTLIDGELSITVSGVNKTFAVPWLLEKVGIDGAFEAFEEGLIIPEDATGKLTHYYIDKPYEGDIVDYNGVPYHYFTPSGVYLEKYFIQNEVLFIIEHS